MEFKNRKYSTCVFEKICMSRTYILSWKGTSDYVVVFHKHIIQE